MAMIKEATRKKYAKLVESDYAGLPAVTNPVMQNAIYQVIENTTKELSEATTDTVNVAQYTPVLISLIRRTLPTLVGPQIVGLQPLALPTGRIFVQHVWADKTGDGSNLTEVWANGTVGTADSIGVAPDATLSGPYTTADGEDLGWAVTNQSSNTAVGQPSVNVGENYPEMSFTIDAVDVSVKTRALKGKITTEIIQDLKAVHGLDAEQEIANILQTELTAEIDREIVNRIYTEAKTGAQNCSTPGVFDFSSDGNGRWSMEQIIGLLVQIEREATIIAQETRRGRGNFIITSPELAAYLSMANMVTNEYKAVGFTEAVNPVGVSYYGTLANRFKVFVDPYLSGTSNQSGQMQHALIVGYKGTNEYDSGMFYCPYVPLQLFKSVGQEDFGSRLGVKSRYGLISNPYYLASNSQNATAKTNSFFRKLLVVVD